jgi:SAM-dependent methyltransferase
MTSENPLAKIFTDGACLGNPGPGGYAALIKYAEDEHIIVGGDPETTNNESSMTSSDAYLLGRAAAEEGRFRRQMAMLAPESDAQLEKIGIKPGERVLDLGCGPGGVLDLLGRRVGPTGSVLGIERSPRFIELARRFVGDHGLTQIVTVEEGDVYDTGLPRASFDGAHMRLVLANVPEPERIVREMVSLVRPSGWVASFEADYLTLICDPPLPAWSRLVEAFKAYSIAQGIDLFIGRRTH